MYILSLFCSSELNAAGNSRPLAMILVRNVEKAIKLFTMKCEELVGTAAHSEVTLIPCSYVIHLYGAWTIILRSFFNNCH